MKTIGLGALLLVIIFMSRAMTGAEENPFEALDDRIAISSVTRVLSPDTFVAPPAMPELPAPNSYLERQTSNIEPSIPNVSAPPSSIDGVITGVAGAVIDLDSGAILWERRPFQRHPLASLTKLMTAVVALENIGADKTVTVTDEDILAEGDMGAFKSGEAFSVRDLVAAMLLASSNDAADAIARFYGVKPFVDAMQQKAAAYKLSDTSFFDPSGLSSLNQSTVEDAMKFVRAVRSEHPELFALSAQKEFAIVEHTFGKSRVIKSINEFAGQPDFLGGKTGYTPEAHGNLISLFRHGGEDILIIIFGTDDRFGETKLLYDWAKSRLTEQQ